MKQIVLEIPDDKYDGLIKQMKLDRNFSQCKITLLPEHHGLVSIDDVDDMVYDYSNSCDTNYSQMWDDFFSKIPVIIPAMKGEKDASCD